MAGSCRLSRLSRRQASILESVMTWYCSSQAGHPGVCTSRTAPAVVALFFAQPNGMGVIAILAESPQHHHPSPLHLPHQSLPVLSVLRALPLCQQTENHWLSVRSDEQLLVIKTHPLHIKSTCNGSLSLKIKHGLRLSKK